MDFYALIIGTEILNQRREDKHFAFLAKELLKIGYTLKGSFVIYDDPELIVATLRWLSTLPKAIIFSFGGIGSTPDDYTRQAAAIALGDGELYEHREAKKIIIEALGKRAYPHAINMANLPKDSQIIENRFNKMPAFSLNNRFFFLPGFPQMSHQMITDILPTLNITPKNIHRYTLTALCRESELIDVMQTMPKEVEMSSLPKIYSDGPRVTISVVSSDAKIAKDNFEKFTNELDRKKIYYSLIDEQ